MRKGIFWCTDPQREDAGIVCVSVSCDACGHPAEPVRFSSKSGENFNHAAEWRKLPKPVTGDRPYNYYPRGRVEIRGGAATVFLHPALAAEKTVRAILGAFGLLSAPDGFSVRIVADGSDHYRSLTEDF